ncbi:MAG: aminomethyl-transferring glycine dehydrogenase subunit GcvPA [candidate division NC10 bacterium]|nr:aminomethyl-transferring glycine dehydrogenase subunit GcvPA [candidate division NC10 bacterium]
MRYLPHTPADIEVMLQKIGLPSLEALFGDIPAELRVQSELDLPQPLSESELIRHLQGIASLNADPSHYSLFLGAGAYQHFVPSVVEEVIGREEFYTAYTPYQPELSQGTLQATYEYQTLICQLTGMEVANASLYDGASATAEAALMACRIGQRNKILASSALHPDYLAVLRTYLSHLRIDLELLPWVQEEGITSFAEAERRLDKEVAALILPSPNFFGCLEEGAPFVDLAHAQGALLIAVVAEATSLGILKPPGEWGADIVAGEGQSFGNPLNFGGPYLGIFATQEKFVRQMPGRLVGRTTDAQGRPGFVLALGTREQHIRREKATSNICTNEALCALAAAVHLCLLGPQGLRELALLNLQKAHYAKQQIAALSGFQLPFSAPTYNEFAVRLPKPAKKINQGLLGRGIIGGLDLGRFSPEMEDCSLFCITEMNTKAEIDRLVSSLDELARGGK